MIEVILSGLVSKIINDSIDISKRKIKEADKNRKQDCNNFQTRLYQVLVDVLKQFITDKIEVDSDKIYDAAEEMLKGFRNRENSCTISIKRGLIILIPDIDNDKCDEFIQLFCEKICSDENDVLYRGIMLIINLKSLNNNVNGGIDNFVKKIDGNIQS